MLIVLLVALSTGATGAVTVHVTPPARTKATAVPAALHPVVGSTMPYEIYHASVPDTALIAAPHTEPVDPPTARAGQAISAPIQSADPTLPGWTLIWHDEFGGQALDSTRWNIQSDDAGGYRVCCLNYGEQYWTPDAIQVRNGVLRIATEAHPRGGKSYTSGAVTTERTFAFMYGRVDIRARLPVGQGLWPAFWLLPVGENWQGRAPYEIDIMEALGNAPHTVYMTNHRGDEYAMCTFTADDFSHAFHVFSVDWAPGVVTWSIDGNQRCRITAGVSERPMYLILNSALGGDWPGPPNQTTPLPQYLEVDSVRVYQRISQPSGAR